ncbi:hypothetical protein [Hydrogenophaga pseudoflava]|uniref:hypothetical protein n=1 Tax=Hydrogenophaga pseudoflava TaxID=47421 RepID=UPI0027E3B39F|nr:hypothetical protein [Hydrogenophaga pseudoflava]MDQ7747344.1 hypothetical protein [Hydrogenophaga pseudoflava]
MNIPNRYEQPINGMRRVALAGAAACALMLSACTAIEKAGYASDIDKGRAMLLHHVKTLQAAGDPLGDYFYALGNSDGWIKDVQDDEAITELFRQAAAKGSMDAKILLALQKATSRPVPGKLDEGMSPRGNVVAWEAGLAELLPLLQQQCYVRRLVVGSRDLGTELRPHVTTYAVAYKIWPTFRDGYYRNNQDGTRTLLRDPERHKLWQALEDNCKQPADQWLDRLYNK